MDNKSDDQFLIRQAMFDSNRKDSDEKMKRSHRNVQNNDGSDSNFELLTRQYGFTKGQETYHCGID